MSLPEGLSFQVGGFPEDAISIELVIHLGNKRESYVTLLELFPAYYDGGEEDSGGANLYYHNDALYRYRRGAQHPETLDFFNEQGALNWRNE